MPCGTPALGYVRGIQFKDLWPNVYCDELAPYVSCTRTVGDGPHHFEPRSSDEDELELASPFLTSTTLQREDV
ncbi:hypothetical protein TNCV_1779961 [Trichonephila clavipes]|nr:hypothetical protein TNCV_1779961 [Trichonephila clavipes]